MTDARGWRWPTTVIACLVLLSAFGPISSVAGAPAPSASVSLDQSVYSASLYGATSDVRVVFSGVVHVHSQIGHWVSLALTVAGTNWPATLSPATITRQTDDDVRFTGWVDVPRGASAGGYALEVHGDDNSELFPIHARAPFELSVTTGPLAISPILETESPRVGGNATWSVTIRNLASYDLDYDPVFSVPSGFHYVVMIPGSNQLLAPGAAVSLIFTLLLYSEASVGPHTWSVNVVSTGHPEATTSVDVPFVVMAALAPPASSTPDFLATYWLPISLGMMAFGLVLFFSLTEVGYLALAFSVFAPLFSRLKRDKVLDNFTRGQIYGYIRANPGVHYSAVQQSLDIENGVLAYHLHVLLRENYLVARNEGVYKRFYPRDYKIPKRRTLLTRLQVDILEEVTRRPGVSQREVAVALGESKQVVSYNIGVLRDAGMLLAERRGREMVLRPPDGARDSLQTTDAEPSAGGEPSDLTMF